MKSSTNWYKLLSIISWISLIIAIPGKTSKYANIRTNNSNSNDFFSKFFVFTKSQNLYINRRRIMRRIDLCAIFTWFIASFKNNLWKKVLLAVGQVGSRTAISKTPFLLNYCFALLILTHIFKESRILEILVQISHFFFQIFYKLFAPLSHTLKLKFGYILESFYFFFTLTRTYGLK
jgi:hypothetical protein